MRHFSSYGPPDPALHYIAPRADLIKQATKRILGEDPQKGGHYLTIWAPRQNGKTWVMQQVTHTLQKDNRFSVVKLNLEHLKRKQDPLEVLRSLSSLLIDALELSINPTQTEDDFFTLFSQKVLNKPLILILDEFDALDESAISLIVSIFRNIYIHRQDESQKATHEKKWLLHSVALIGVRSVLGVENLKGSPFNVQRSLRIPNLTEDEVCELFQNYAKESGQTVQQELPQRVYFETRGQPGLTCWLGELLTETFNHDKRQPLTIHTYEKVLREALNTLPNNNILNLISKAKQEPARALVLELFQTGGKKPFRYDNPLCNFLYMNGVIDREESEQEDYIRFASPFVQKRLFNYFAVTLFDYMGKVTNPFEDLSDTIDETSIRIPNLLARYEVYLKKNRDWLLKDVPRRQDLRVYEAVFHFNLYQFLYHFLGKEAEIIPEFPTGNGKIDLLIRYAGQLYGLELKNFTNYRDHASAIQQAIQYGQQLNLKEITLTCFLEEIDETNRKRLETPFTDTATGITVTTVLIVTGN